MSMMPADAAWDPLLTKGPVQHEACRPAFALVALRSRFRGWGADVLFMQ
jgi:hypothetical protein